MLFLFQIHKHFLRRIPPKHKKNRKIPQNFPKSCSKAGKKCKSSLAKKTQIYYSGIQQLLRNFCSQTCGAIRDRNGRNADTKRRTIYSEVQRQTGMDRKIKKNREANRNKNFMKKNAAWLLISAGAVPFFLGTQYFMAKNSLFQQQLRLLLCAALFFLSASTANAQVGAGAPTLPPEPAPPGYTSLDPYGTPADTNRPLLSNSPSHSFNAFHFGTGTDTRLFQNFGVDMTWITPSASRDNMGLFRMDFVGDITVPLFASQDNPLLFEPRFAINYWTGPQSEVYDMAAHTFDASLGLRWLPKLQFSSMATPLSFDLFFSVGIYSDFKKVEGSSFRFPSWAYVSLDVTNSIKAKVGVWYLDRVRNKIFPSGGVIWTPNDQWEFQLLFPNPRITYRPAGGSLRDMTVFLRGEYGGGCWTVSHLEGGAQPTDYNDYRILLGIDWKGRVKGQGFFELGLSFARELYIADSRKSYDLDPGFILQTGFHF